MKVTLCEEVPEPLMKFCESKDYRCRNCRYSIRRLIPDYKGSADCIFANMPKDWPHYEDN